jgi:hypothetical protein
MINRYTTEKSARGLIGGSRYPVSLTMNRYSPRLLFFLVLIVGLNYLDSCFTMIILESGGKELNPIVDAAINLCGENFWIWKFFIVSLCSIILCLHSRNTGVKIFIVLVSFTYLGLVSYQLIGLHIYNP